MRHARNMMARPICLFLTVATCLGVGGMASADSMKTDVETLSSAEFAGRSIGTPGSTAAAAYLAERFDDIGVMPLTGALHLLPVAIDALTLSGASGSLGAEGRTIATLGTDLTLSQGLVDSTTIEAPITLVRYAANSSTLPDGFDPADVDGHIVITQRVDPPSAPLSEAAAGLLGRLSMSRPAAILTATPGLRDMLQPDPGASATRYRRAKTPANVLGGRLDAGIVNDVFGPTGAPDDYRSVWISTLPSVGRLEVGFDEIRSRALDEVNVAGTVPGSETQETRILLTAHYDHLGTIDGTVYPGADDNASGVAVLLDVVRGLAADPPAVSVDVVFLTGEEHGLLGSQAFVDAPPVSLSSYRAMINVDAIGRPFGDQAEYSDAFFASGLECFPVLADALGIGARETGLRIMGFGDVPALSPLAASCEAQRAGTGGAPSDQMPFLMAGVPSVLLTGGIHADYHQPGDTSDKLDYARLERLSRLIEIAVRRLADAN